MNIYFIKKLFIIIIFVKDKLKSIFLHSFKIIKRIKHFRGLVNMLKNVSNAIDERWLSVRTNYFYIVQNYATLLLKIYGKILPKNLSSNLKHIILLFILCTHWNIAV